MEPLNCLSLSVRYGPLSDESFDTNNFVIIRQIFWRAFGKKYIKEITKETVREVQWEDDFFCKDLPHYMQVLFKIVQFYTEHKRDLKMCPRKKNREIYTKVLERSRELIGNLPLGENNLNTMFLRRYNNNVNILPFFDSSKIKNYLNHLSNKDLDKVLILAIEYARRDMIREIVGSDVLFLKISNKSLKEAFLLLVKKGYRAVVCQIISSKRFRGMKGEIFLELAKTGNLKLLQLIQEHSDVINEEDLGRTLIAAYQGGYPKIMRYVQNLPKFSQIPEECMDCLCRLMEQESDQEKKELLKQIIGDWALQRPEVREVLDGVLGGVLDGVIHLIGSQVSHFM